MGVCSCRHLAISAQDERDGIGHSVPVLDLGFELFAACRSERVELRPAVVFRVGPLGLNPATVFEAVKRGIQRALPDLEKLA